MRQSFRLLCLATDICITKNIYTFNVKTKWQKSVTDQSRDERHVNLRWKISHGYLKAALRSSALRRRMWYLVEKWDDKSAAWIKVKMFSLYTQTPVSHVSEICVANFRDRLTGKFLHAVVEFYLNFSNKDSYLWRDTRTRFIYRFIALTLFIRVREFFARWSPVPRPTSLLTFLFLYSARSAAKSYR